ncbi:MAG: hypothetical protein KBT10_10100 [Bacteroidales bacterium]|nr:hypothetical protein [Candidatus Sodaliphilus aphodohippi]
MAAIVVTPCPSGAFRSPQYGRDEASPHGWNGCFIKRDTDSVMPLRWGLYGGH